ncbi:MAG: DapH/DapD/GlmU-related protein [Dehalococcoidia bacterium]
MIESLIHATKRLLAARDRHGLWPVVAGLLIRRKFNKKSVILWAGGRPMPRIENHGRIEASSCAVWSGVRLEVAPCATLFIGKGTILNRDTVIVCHDSVEIGANCKISYQVIIMDSDEHQVPGSPQMTAPIRIEDDVWLGARVIVLKGVTIGAGAIVGAGSIVTKDLPQRSISAGQPARVLRFY